MNPLSWNELASTFHGRSLLRCATGPSSASSYIWRGRWWDTIVSETSLTILWGVVDLSHVWDPQLMEITMNRPIINTSFPVAWHKRVSLLYGNYQGTILCQYRLHRGVNLSAGLDSGREIASVGQKTIVGTFYLCHPKNPMGKWVFLCSDSCSNITKCDFD
jgi:hypothetical protein